MQINPYLNFNGRCAEAFRFYEQCFGGKLEALMTHGESPMASCVGPDWHDKVIHARLTVGDKVLMGSDAPPEHYRNPQGFCVTINVRQPADAERTFKALAENGSIQMPLQKTFWSPSFGMVTDRFGIPWMINCEPDA